MDYMDSGMRYLPKSDSDWDPSVQFLPASDNKKLEKKKGPSKIGALFGVIIFAAVIALMTGLLVWHFHYRKDVRVKKIYTGSLHITNQVFENAYENSNSTEFQALAKQVISQLKAVYSKSPALAKYYIGSTVQAFSEGSVIAYYLSEFSVPKGQEASVDSAILSMDKLVDKTQRSFSRAGSDLVFDDVVASALDTRMLATSFHGVYRYSLHTSPNLKSLIKSVGFPDAPYPPNSFATWELRADPGYVLKLDFDTVFLEEDCKNDFIKIYDSLAAIESRTLEEICGHYSPTDPLGFISSGNVMLLTMATNDENNYPGFKAVVSQIPRQELKCGGKLTGKKGSFSSPNYPNYYPPRTTCQWSIEVPAGKVVKVSFKIFLLFEPGDQNLPICSKDYVEIKHKKLCGEKPADAVTETSNSNKLSVKFYSDDSFVDRGFLAEYEAVDPQDFCPKQFQCDNGLCKNLELKCDGWNDCGDMSDELNCECKSEDIKCKNGLCKPMMWKCDGIDDCGDGTDEKDCGGCPSGELTCNNNKCVSEKKHCDGNNDCGDGSDELGCQSDSDVSCTDLTYRCQNNKCISKVNPECDETTDCKDASDEKNCDCGKNLIKTSRIVGGQNAAEGEFPWQVSLQVSGNHVCGAALISNIWLLTAAHCVQDVPTIRYSQPSTWKVYLGLHTQGVAENVVTRNLQQIIPHPNYNSYTYDNDIALMKLDSPVDNTDYIRPICMPSPQHVFETGESVWITGWGARREGGGAATTLQKAKVRIINSETCNKLMGDQITSRMLCAGVLEGGIDACQGDSGGPLSVPSISGRMFLGGLVSWGEGCAQKNKPGIYTRITKFRGWITEKMGV
ncbi:suppression of tumorigenicity 14a [Thalassophryne amazonica]|uniref:suppression of tumorigenicity 14a n=1 Tax=Thalassophryne amazonica TaxID=390379 RepID=UPI001471911C|nr:suppression of tumorigenicity 14a [Thalassophryne amazonica]